MPAEPLFFERTDRLDWYWKFISGTDSKSKCSQEKTKEIICPIKCKRSFLDLAVLAVGQCRQSCDFITRTAYSRPYAYTIHTRLKDACSVSWSCAGRLSPQNCTREKLAYRHCWWDLRILVQGGVRPLTGLWEQGPFKFQGTLTPTGMPRVMHNDVDIPVSPTVQIQLLDE